MAARTWHWVLHGCGRGPISHRDWTRFDGHGPPSAATLAAERTASEATRLPAHPPGRAQPGPVHLLTVHLRTRRRGTTAVPPLGRRPRTHRQ
jgi:hypothetical protein